MNATGWITVLIVVTGAVASLGDFGESVSAESSSPPVWLESILLDGEVVFRSSPPLSIDSLVDSAKYNISVASGVDSLTGRYLGVSVLGDVATVESVSHWFVSPHAGDGGQIIIASPVSIDQARNVVNLAAPSIEPGEYISSVRPAERLKRRDGEFVTVILPNTIDIWVSRGVMKGGRIISVESVGDSVRVFESGIINH